MEKEIILFAVGVACFRLFLEHCFQVGEILAWYYDLIIKLPDLIAKPLGKCLVCSNFWLSTALYFTYFDFRLLTFAVFIGISYGAIKYLSDLL